MAFRVKAPCFIPCTSHLHYLCRIAGVIPSSYQELCQVLVHCLLPSLSCPLRLRYLDPSFWSKSNLLSFATRQKICFTRNTTELLMFYFIFWFAAQSFTWLIFKDNMEESGFVHMDVFIIAGINLLLCVF